MVFNVKEDKRWEGGLTREGTFETALREIVSCLLLSFGLGNQFDHDHLETIQLTLHSDWFL
jgi:hypothetical protein